MARGGPKTTRNACNAARLVVVDHQDEAQAAASWCSRPVPSSEAAVNDGGVGRDRNGRDRDATADSERAPSAQFTGHVALDVVECPTRRSPSAVLQARPCTEIDGCKPLGKMELLPRRAAAVGVLSARGKRHLKPLDLTHVVFSDAKFFRLSYRGFVQNNPIWVVGAHGRLARKADHNPDARINEHRQAPRW